MVETAKTGSEGLAAMQQKQESSKETASTAAEDQKKPPGVKSGLIELGRAKNPKAHEFQPRGSNTARQSSPIAQGIKTLSPIQSTEFENYIKYNS